MCARHGRIDACVGGKSHDRDGGVELMFRVWGVPMCACVRWIHACVRPLLYGSASMQGSCGCPTSGAGGRKRLLEASNIAPFPHSHSPPPHAPSPHAGRAASSSFMNSSKLPSVGDQLPAAATAGGTLSASAWAVRMERARNMASCRKRMHSTFGEVNQRGVRGGSKGRLRRMRA
eukprot:1194718-Prorocentrum_minimum.AAC.14